MPPPSAALGPFDSTAVRFGCAVLIACYAWLILSFWAQGNGPGDFSVFWAAGRLALAGKAAAAYDWASIKQFQPAESRVANFCYPPFFLLALVPFALFPFVAAAAIWLGTNLIAYLAAMRAILPGRTATLAALAAPTVLFNFIDGQNGLLTAGLLGAGLALLDTRPAVAGAMIGMLAYKPQFGILLPLFLAATGRWRVFGSAALTVAGLAGISLALFGSDALAAFAHAMSTANAAYLQHGETRQADVLGWDELASVYGMLRALGAGAGAAWTLHIAIAAAAALAALRIAAGNASDALKAAMVATAALIVTPYSEVNDLAIASVATAFLARDGLANGLRGWEAAALAGVFVLPLSYVVLPAVGSSGSSHRAWLIGPLCCGLLVAAIAWRLTGRLNTAPASLKKDAEHFL